MVFCSKKPQPPKRSTQKATQSYSQTSTQPKLKTAEEFMLHHATSFAHSTSLPTSWIRSGSCIQRFTKSGRALGSVGCPSCVSSPDQEPVPLAKSKLFHHGDTGREKKS